MSISTLQAGGPVMPLEAAVDADCREFRGGHTAVCAILNQPYGPFQKRISVAYPEHHLHADDLARVIELVRGENVKRWFEQAYGVVSYAPVPVAASKAAMKALGKLLEEEGEFVMTLAGGAADNKWEQHEVGQLEQHGFALIERLLGIMTGARQAMEGAQHG